MWVGRWKASFKKDERNITAVVKKEPRWYVSSFISTSDIEFRSYCEKNEISHNFFVLPRTPQQNDVVERKNNPIKMERIVFYKNSLSKYLLLRLFIK